MSERERNRRTRPLTDEDGEVRELTLSDFRRMKPVREVMPDLIEAVEDYRRKAGRPKSETPKEQITFRLAADVVEGVKATGRGYNARVEQALREAFVTPETAHRAAKAPRVDKAERVPQKAPRIAKVVSKAERVASKQAVKRDAARAKRRAAARLAAGRGAGKRRA